MSKAKYTKLKNGLTVIVEENPALRSVTTGIMVGTGSAYETPENNGISHFIEHMQFKGTATRTAADIVNAFEAAGANFNAFTGKEYTCYYVKSIDEKTEVCFELLSDLFLHSAYEKTELDRERKVIIEEINMSLDEPDGVCYDVLHRAAFGGSLGMEILGTKKNVTRFDKSDIDEYKKTHYLPSNTVVAFVGNISEESALELVEKYFGEFTVGEYIAPPRLTEQAFSAKSGEYIHDYEQSELIIAFPAFTLKDDRAPALSILDLILGTGMSSRLFQRIRERMGLVYSIYSSLWLGIANGMITVNANVNVTNVKSSVEAIKEEIDKLVNAGVTAAEIEKAKMQLKVNSLFGKENPMSYMLSLLRRMTVTGEEYDLDALIERIDRTTADEVNALAKEIFASKAAFGYAGKKPLAGIDSVYYGK